MKIAIEAQRIFRKKKHGMDIVVLELIRHLQRIDLENEYYILVRKDEDSNVLSETSNFHILELPAVPYPIWEQYYLPKAVKKIAPDILHCTSNTGPLLWNIGVPLILTLHDILFMQRLPFANGTWYQKFGNLYRRWLVPKIIPRCSGIITVSDFERNEILNYFSLKEDDVHVVYNAFNENYGDHTNPDQQDLYRKENGLPDRYLLYLGNTDPKKNIKNVLMAYSIFCRTNLHVIPLVMPDVSNFYVDLLLKKIKRPELRKYIHLPGYVSNDELRFFYQGASAFLYPSFYESFGIPLLESMACGIPVISSRRGAIPEVAGDAAFLVDPDSPDEIASAISSIVNYKSVFQKLQTRGLMRVKLFSWNNTAVRTLAVYQGIYQNNRAFPSKIRTAL